MISNYWTLPNGGAINVLPVTDSNRFSRWTDWRERRAYYFSGLDFVMLVCPFTSAEDELLVQRPGLYLKTNLSLGGVVYFPSLPEHHNRTDFMEDTAWIADSYLFKFNATRSLSHANPTPHLYVDYANNIPSHGPNVFDNARVIATSAAKSAITRLNQRYAGELMSLIASEPDHIQIANYAQTSLLEEVCTHENFRAESHKYLNALVQGSPETLNSSVLTKGYEQITCTKKYNRTVLSFYLAAVKEPFPNSPGSYIGMFKNFYNILEYLMKGEGEGCLRAVLHDHVGDSALRAIIIGIKTSAHPQSVVLNYMANGEQFSGTRTLPPISENDPDLVARIAERLYTKRNAALHSKKTFRAASVDHNIRPGQRESFQLETDLAIIRPIAENIIENLDPNE